MSETACRAEDTRLHRPVPIELGTLAPCYRAAFLALAGWMIAVVVGGLGVLFVIAGALGIR
jgi:hypothetical protein